MQSFFKSGIHSKSCYALLSKYPSASLIANTHLTTITNILDSNSRGKFKKEHARNLKELAKQSVNCKLRTAVNINIKHIIENITLLKSQLDDIEKLILELLYQLDSTITSIPGMGVISAASIIAEIGDINQFSSPSKLVAFAGLDPKVIQSGTFIASSTRMSKRGSKYLRHTLIFSAFNVSQNDPTFGAYYDKKRSEGKSHYCALGHVAKKLLHLLFKLMTTNTLFISNYEGKF